MIKVTPTQGNQYKVTVNKGTETSHLVTIRPDDYERLTGGESSHEDLLQESFLFLLERESNTSILREFDLMTIQRYFPDYEREIKSRLGAG